MDIHYTSEPEKEYVTGLGKCKSLGELVLLTEKFKRIANDAFLVAQKMTESDFAEFVVGIKKERRGQFAGEDFSDKYGVVMIPETMIRVGLIAQQFMVPFGCAFIRSAKNGLITESDGIATFKGKP